MKILPIVLKPYHRYWSTFTFSPMNVCWIVFIIAICTGMRTKRYVSIYSHQSASHSEINILIFWDISHDIISSKGISWVIRAGSIARKNILQSVIGRTIGRRLFFKCTIDCSTLSTKFGFASIMGFVYRE